MLWWVFPLVRAHNPRCTRPAKDHQSTKLHARTLFSRGACRGGGSRLNQLYQFNQPAPVEGHLLLFLLTHLNNHHAGHTAGQNDQQGTPMRDQAPPTFAFANLRNQVKSSSQQPLADQDLKGRVGGP